MNVQVLAEAQKRGHEQVVFFNYPNVGLRAIVAIHNTVLGPALGGCRLRMYENESQALDDVMRLSEGMTYKSSLAGLDLGGGKSVLIADPKMSAGRREMFLKFAECLNNLNGRYITAEDMGTSVADVMIMREISKFAAGFAQDKGGSGDPSPFTARGVFQAMLAACERRYGSKDLKGRHVSVQGVGHVGMFLVEMLKEAGAKISVCDTNEAALREAKDKFGVNVVSTDAIYDLDAQIYSPCAIGQTVNPQTIGRLKCEIICGGANNQLLDSSMYAPITERKMTYCPDFVVNAGGVISVGGEYNQGGWNRTWVTQKVMNIFNTTLRVLDESDRRKRFPEVVAVELAKERIKEAEERRASVRATASCGSSKSCANGH
ncbi:MAG: leucine dehydrogenase [Oligoflexia bacterium]|nr:leucine dehydrogenase [Oligoflexia bacterium]